MIKPRLIDYYMKVAQVTSELSYAKRLKVGSVIVKDGRILSFGYNGTPAGWDNECEYEVNGETKTKPEVIHSEENAILKLARDGESGKGAAIFITHAPCVNCARLIYNSGIKNVIYGVPYRDNSGVDFLEKTGVKVSRFADKIEEKCEKTALNNDEVWKPDMEEDFYTGCMW